MLRNKRKHSSSTNSSPVRTHKRKHHHHGSKSERKKHKEHKSREEKLSHKHKRKKHHKEQLPDLPNPGDVPDDEFKMPSTRSAVTVVKKPTDPKVLLLAPDLESPLLPPCVQNFSEPPAELLAMSEADQEMVNNDESGVSCDAVVPIVKTPATSSESLEEDGIEEGEILEGTGTNTPTGSIDPPLKDNKVRKLKRKPSQSTESSLEKQNDHRLKKRKWKKDKEISGGKTKKHKIR